MPEACLEKTTCAESPRRHEPLQQSSYLADAAETIKNYAENWGGVRFKENVGPDEQVGKYAFQSLHDSTCLQTP